jgi:hypothetical protein
MNETIKLQKATAKTAVRHLRTYSQNIYRLIEKVNDTIQLSHNKNHKSDLADIIFHLENIGKGINSSENDFQDILGEELKEENKIVSELFSDTQKLKSKLIEIEKLRKDKEKVNKDKLASLSEEINLLRSKISSGYNKLPIGSNPNLPTDSATISNLISNSDKIALTLNDFIKKTYYFNNLLSLKNASNKDTNAEENQNIKNSK